MSGPSALELNTAAIPGTENMARQHSYERVRPTSLQSKRLGSSRRRRPNQAKKRAPLTRSPCSRPQVQTYPVVKDTLAQAYSLVQSNTYSTAIYDRATTLALSILQRLEPLQNRLPLETVDGYANQTLDFVEKRFPQVKSDTADLYKQARQPADQAAGIAKAYADGIQSVSLHCITVLPLPCSPARSEFARR